MVSTDITQTGTIDLDGSITDFSVDSKILDSPSPEGETVYMDNNWSTYLGYYRTTMLKAPLDSLAIWSVGKGYTADDRTNTILDNITGRGDESFTEILFNGFICMKISEIGSFAEIIRNDNGTLINLKPLNTGTMAVIENAKGRIIRYEQRIGKKKPITFKPEQIFHRTNDRLGDSGRGTSVVESIKWIIDAREEAMRDWRRISHRSSVRILYVDEDDKTRRTNLKTDYKEAIDKGQLLILPIKKGDGEFVDLQLPPVQAFTDWIRYLDNLFYQAVRIPKTIATSEGTTEAGGKMGHVNFEPIYTWEQKQLEDDLWNQLAIKVKFNRPPSLMNNLQQDEQKNAGQTGFQPNDVEAGVGE